VLSDEQKERMQANHLHNISTGGLSFQTDEAILPGEALLIRIAIQKPPFEAEGTVVWCDKYSDGYQVGVHFEQADIDYALRMIEQICHIEQYRNEIQRREGRKLSSEEAANEWISLYASDFPY
jgi:hypothetical protein